MLRRSRWLRAMPAAALVLAMGCSGADNNLPPSPMVTDAVTVKGTPVAPTPATVSVATSTPGPTTSPTAASHRSPPPVPTAIPTMPPTATPTAVPTESPTLINLEILEGSRARYKVREQFADQSFPNDAVGETSDVRGSIVFDGKGSVRAGESVLVVDLRTLRSDDPDRDDFLRGESLESDRYPFAEFRVLEARGLPWPLPEEGQGTFQLHGDMTLHNYTRPLTWEVTAQFAPDQVSGTARTNFTFGTFHMVRPSRFFLLSVEDDIRLELDFIVSVGQTEVESPEGQ